MAELLEAIARISAAAVVVLIVATLLGCLAWMCVYVWSALL